MTRIIYISGPITGMIEDNQPAFAAMAARLRADGHTVINPHVVFPGEGPEHLAE